MAFGNGDSFTDLAGLFRDPTDDELASVDYITRRDFEDFVALLEAKILTSQQAIVERTHLLITGLLPNLSSGFEHVAAAFGLPGTFQRGTKGEKKGSDWHLVTSVASVLSFPSLPKHIEDSVGNYKALLWWKELHLQPVAWTDCEQAFWKEFLKKEANYDIVSKLRKLFMPTMGLSFHTYLQNFRDF